MQTSAKKPSFYLRDSKHSPSSSSDEAQDTSTRGLQAHARFWRRVRLRSLVDPRATSSSHGRWHGRPRPFVMRTLPVLLPCRALRVSFELCKGVRRLRPSSNRRCARHLRARRVRITRDDRHSTFVVTRRRGHGRILCGTRRCGWLCRRGRWVAREDLDHANGGSSTVHVAAST